MRTREEDGFTGSCHGLTQSSRSSRADKVTTYRLLHPYRYCTRITIGTTLKQNKASTAPSRVATGDSIDALLARSGDLKGELVEFAQSPRFSRQLNARLDAAADHHGHLDETTAVLTIDHFALQHRLPDGRTVLERFVAQRRPPLSEDEREMLFGWRDVVEGSFEVQRLEGDCAVFHNLLDDLVYRVYSNMGRRAFAALRKGMFVIGRIVPLHPVTDAWLVSGHLATFPKSAGPQIAQTAVEMVTANPQLLRRNPEALRRAWQMQAEDRADFIELFGSDVVVLPPGKAQQMLQEHHRRRWEKALAGLDKKAAQRARATGPTPEEMGRLPEELLQSESVGLVYDEAEGLNYYADFGRLDALFADPALTRDRASLTQLREYLGDESVSPLAIRRLVERHPQSADTVFRTLLRKPDFRWERDGEELLRRRKKSFFDHEPMPSITPIGGRLAELLRAGR
jgi:hypothetical protein